MSIPVDRDNQTWLAHLRAGADEQQAALADLRNALLRGLRRAFVGYGSVNEALLEDAAQDAMLRILDRLQQFEGRSRFVTWATSIAIRVAMTELRRRRWKDVSLDEVVETRPRLLVRPASEAGAEPSRHTEQHAIVDKMYDVINQQLTEKQRTALLAELRGMPQAEIGRHLGSNRNAVYKLTHDARKKLKRGLEEAGYGAEHVSAAFGG